MRIQAILVSAFALISLSASAQDKIYKRNGDIIDGKVKEVNTRTVSYKKQDNPDGPDYVINRGEVVKIKYQNGSEDYMNGNDEREARTPRKQVTYGGNIISLAPINLSEHGYGVGVAYERLLDKKGHVSFYLPVNVCLGGLGGSTRYDNFGNPVGNTQKRTIYQVLPGVKFYPTGNHGRVRYALGAQLVYQTGTIEREQWIYDVNTPNTWGYYKRDDVSIQKLGVMINNSLNMYPTQHLFIGIDLGLGVPYSHKEEDLSTGVMVERGADAPMVQLNFRLGYRF